MTSTNTKVNWLIVSLSYIIAFGISAIFNSGWFSSTFNFTDTYFINNWTFLPACLGTLIAALFAFYFDKNVFKTITFFGNHKSKNILIALVPFVVFGITALTQPNANYGFVAAVVALVYALAEEIFWRGYLQNAISLPNKNNSYLLIGVLWWAWHFRFSSSFDFTGFLPICIVSTFLLGKFTDETKSFLTSAGLHSLIILITSTGEMTNPKIVAGVITVLVWLAFKNFGKQIQQTKP